MKSLFHLALLALLFAGLTAASAFTSAQAHAPNGTATLFVAHRETHEDASLVPIPAAGGQPVPFEVRVREAGDGAKAGWQIRIALDACRFETPLASNITLGDYLSSGTVISVGPAVELKGNQVLINAGQFNLEGSTTAAEGLLATITVTPKRSFQCPEPTGTPQPEAQAVFDLAILSAPGGVKYSVTTLNGRFLFARPTFVPLMLCSS